MFLFIASPKNPRESNDGWPRGKSFICHAPQVPQNCVSDCALSAATPARYLQAHKTAEYNQIPSYSSDRASPWCVARAAAVEASSACIKIIFSLLCLKMCSDLPSLIHKKSNAAWKLRYDYTRICRKTKRPCSNSSDCHQRM